RANNIAFDSTAAIAFIGSATGMLFAFNAETGELESYHPIGSELRRIALSEKSRTITAVRSTAGGDEIVVVDFETGEAEEAADGSSPVIESLQPSVTGQGRLKDLRLTVVGRNFAEGAALVVNGSDVPARLAQSGNALEAKLDKSLFDQPGEIQIRVKNASGELSEPAALRVVRPNTPAIDKIKPAEVPGPAEEFTLKVTGMHFRSSSAIYVGNTALPTEALGETELQARVPADIARTVKKHRVTVRDRALRDLISNETRLDIYGPRVSEIKPRRDPVAGTGAVVVIVRGENFRQGAQVAVKGEVLPAERVTRISSSAIKVSVPGRMTQEAGTIPVIVRNKEGGESEPKSFDALPPKITGFDPAQTLAGVADVKIGIQGEHFRKRAKVFVGDTRIPRKRVRFRSNKRIVVILKGSFNELLKQPGQLQFRVVNPNNGSGVSSAPQEFKVAGPEVTEAVIKPLKEDETRVKIIISGQNFRNRTTVEFLKAGDVVRQQEPESVTATRLTLTLRAKRVEALGSFEIRAVNPGEVRSNAIAPRHDGIE
ncbi:MAG TPA: IPT/TIG domain-containing protein, partial [Blastocatellia bacterium]|nr:IPT/TIG domain-containing protein [Blastocatellia bacterium]